MRTIIFWKIFYDDETTFSSDDGKPEIAPLDGIVVILERYDNKTFNIIFGHEFYFWNGDCWSYGGLASLERWLRKILPLVKYGRFTKNEIYKNLFKSVYGFDAGDNTAPENFKMVDRIRNLLERHVQLEVIKSNKDSIILLDGSLIGNTIANPGVHIQKMITQANTNNNSLVAISKFTNLTLKTQYL